MTRNTLAGNRIPVYRNPNPSFPHRLVHPWSTDYLCTGRGGGGGVQDLKQEVAPVQVNRRTLEGRASPPPADMNSSESSTSVRGRGKNKRKWVPAEDDVLIKALHDVSLDPRWRSDGSFKNGYTSVLEARLAEKLPGAKISAVPHVESRLSSYSQNHPDAKGLYGVPFPYYDVLAAVYSKDIATGEGAEDLTDAISNMEQELAAGNGNDEEEEEAQETPRRFVDSTSSSSKKRKKEWKGKKDSVTSDPLLDMFNEVSGDLKVVTKSIGKMAQTMERDTTNQEKSMNEDP
ncbi:uncharacterized protein C2845_PM11G10720 [Panicum miliaceum]|uniref:Myb/SANT-like domain-containing protein n=1 Tax=Panicum miliaceum TaxID=4540 RepID=A0A3L6RWR1_PANMI|nr:uncharacterized protein C2845_PM11G10720 [Panicum miliaceum]